MWLFDVNMPRGTVRQEAVPIRNSVLTETVAVTGSACYRPEPCTLSSDRCWSRCCPRPEHGPRCSLRSWPCATSLVFCRGQREDRSLFGPWTGSCGLPFIIDTSAEPPESPGTRGKTASNIPAAMGPPARLGPASGASRHRLGRAPDPAESPISASWTAISDRIAEDDLWESSVLARCLRPPMRRTGFSADTTAPT